MKKSEYNVVIIDDHPLISEAYKSALDLVSTNNSNVNFNITVVENCDDANQLIIDSVAQKKIFDLVFLDIRLPPSKDGKLLSGEDLGLKINQLMPDSKIIVATTLNDNYRIHALLKNINPDGFLTKNDMTPKELVLAIETILNDPPYYSKTIVKLLRHEVSNDFILDDIDRRILYELSMGSRMKDLPNIVHLSIAGIEKRKRHLKQIFDAIGPEDKELISKARDKGFI
ncbi:MAG: response regulator transcription factor [Algicola sp.]|nr:response regulator transcription factor [Algicola sp.]